MGEHLRSCVNYLTAPANDTSYIAIAYRESKLQKRRENDDLGDEKDIKRVRSYDGLVQKKFHSGMAAAGQYELDKLAAEALYCEAKPFNNWNGLWTQRFIKKLNKDYKIPDRERFSTDLLDDAYEACRAEVFDALRACHTLNFVTDGSSNIHHERINNLSVSTTHGIFHLEAEEIPDEKHNAATLIKWTDEKVKLWVEGRPHTVNSLATDTENKMRAVWKGLYQDCPNWERVFFVPCDSHGLQLLMKHMSELVPGFSSIFKQAQQIASFFHKGDKQLAILRSYMKRAYGRHFAITLSVITRWGTQIRLIKSLIRSKEALRAWANHAYELEADEDRQKTYRAVVSSIQGHTFWNDLEDLREIFEPIHTAQVMSESNKAHLGYVVKRWNDIELHLRGLKIRPNYRHNESLEQVFRPRVNRYGKQVKSIWAQTRDNQVLDIHYVAFHLDPANHAIAMDGEEEADRVIDFLTKYIDATDTEMAIIEKAFLDFKGQRNRFASGHRCWKRADDPEHFWAIAAQWSPK